MGLLYYLFHVFIFDTLLSDVVNWFHKELISCIIINEGTIRLFYLDKKWPVAFRITGSIQLLAFVVRITTSCLTNELFLPKEDFRMASRSVDEDGATRILPDNTYFCYQCIRMYTE